MDVVARMTNITAEGRRKWGGRIVAVRDSIPRSGSRSVRVISNVGGEGFGCGRYSVGN